MIVDSKHDVFKTVSTSLLEFSKSVYDGDIDNHPLFETLWYVRATFQSWLVFWVGVKLHRINCTNINFSYQLKIYKDSIILF